MISNLAQAITSPAGALAVLASLLWLTMSRSSGGPALAGERLGGAAVITGMIAAAVYSSVVLSTAVIGA